MTVEHPVETLTPALRQWRGRAPMPTHLSSAELRSLGRDVWRRSVMSARTTNAAYLAEVAEVLDDVIAGRIEMATAKMRLYFKLKELGYDPEVGFPEDMGKVPAAQRGSLRDLSSQKRLKLVLETNRQMAAGYGRMVEGNRDYALYTWPAWELVRIYDRDVPRGSPDSHSIGWAQRWRDAGGKFYEGGRMIARKDSAVWQALGDGTGGYEDTLGNPYPPFAFRSGFGWVAVEREECLRLGIITGEDVPERTEATLEDTGGDAVRKIYQSWPEDIRQQFQAELAERRETTRDWLRKELEEHKARQIAESLPLQNAGYDPSQPRGWRGRWGFLMAPDKGGQFGGGGEKKDRWQRVENLREEAKIKQAINRGRAAMWQVIETEKDVEGAMSREGIDEVDFVWSRDGCGIKHILERRLKQDAVHPGRNKFSVEELLEMIPEVIAGGEIQHKGNKAIITLNGLLVVLAKSSTGNTWLMSGYEIWPEEWRSR